MLRCRFRRFKRVCFFFRFISPRWIHSEYAFRVVFRILRSGIECFKPYMNFNSAFVSFFDPYFKRIYTCEFFILRGKSVSLHCLAREYCFAMKICFQKYIIYPCIFQSVKSGFYLFFSCFYRS